MDYWQGNPPLHVMVKRYLGEGTPDTPPPEPDMNRIIHAFNQP